ncbi:hypothetical protein HUJ05_005214 [Dendroctonus ponderosae]|nr:hypothetical protein HUJ05_005214 [Dendroctonus ponderosae]
MSDLLLLGHMPLGSKEQFLHFHILILSEDAGFELFVKPRNEVLNGCHFEVCVNLGVAYIPGGSRHSPEDFVLESLELGNGRFGGLAKNRGSVTNLGSDDLFLGRLSIITIISRKSHKEGLGIRDSYRLVFRVFAVVLRTRADPGGGGHGEDILPCAGFTATNANFSNFIHNKSLNFYCLTPPLTQKLDPLLAAKLEWAVCPLESFSVGPGLESV